MLVSTNDDCASSCQRALSAFDVQYYLTTSPDLQSAFGTEYSEAFDYWVIVGISEGRKGAAY
jgi:hypothetical protein